MEKQYSLFENNLENKDVLRKSRNSSRKSTGAYDKQPIHFPYNTVGQIKYQSTNRESNELQTNGQGFLISPSLVLTSFRNCVIQSEDGQVKYDTPLYFSLLQQTEIGLMQVIIRVKSKQLNLKFLEIFSQIKFLKRMFLEEKEGARKQQFLKDILKMQQDLAQHDFALLELQKAITRHRYFKLYSNVQQECDLIVCVIGSFFLQQQNSQDFFTHSKKFNQINNGSIHYDIGKKTNQSGCPVYIRQDKTKAVGIINYYNFQQGLSSTTIITQKIVDVLKNWIQIKGIPFKIQNQILGIAESANIIRGRGDQLMSQGKIEESLEQYKKSLFFYEKTENKSTQQAGSYNNIGLIYSNQGKFDKALENYHRAVYILQNQPRENARLANIFNNIAKLYKKLKKDQYAVQYYEKAIKAKQKGRNISTLNGWDIASFKFAVIHNIQRLNEENQDHSNSIQDQLSNMDLTKQLAKRQEKK